MKIQTTLVACLCAGMVIGSAVGGEIAYVNMSALIDAHPRNKADREVLKKQVGDFDAERKEMVGELEDLNQEFEESVKDAGNSALSDVAREAQKKIAQEKLKAVRTQQRKLRETMSQRQNEIQDQEIQMRRQLVGKLRDLVQDYAVKKGYTLVLDSSAVGPNGAETVVYGLDGLDITEDILKMIKGNEKEKTK